MCGRERVCVCVGEKVSMCVRKSVCGRERVCVGERECG